MRGCAGLDLMNEMRCDSTYATDGQLEPRSGFSIFALPKAPSIDANSPNDGRGKERFEVDKCQTCSLPACSLCQLTLCEKSGPCQSQSVPMSTKVQAFT